MIGRLMITIACASLANTKPIMVSFGTNGGPIVPPTPSTTTLNPLAPANPAPVHEDQSDDVPPPVYRAPTPNQYRNLVNSYKPNPDLQLGTPLDIKYQDANALSQLQVQQQKAELARQQGLGYAGAQVFGVQEYEFDNARNKQNQNQGKLSSAQQFVQQYVPKRRVQEQQQQTQPHQEQKQNIQVQTTEKPQKENIRPQRHQQDQAVQGTRYTSVYAVKEPQPQQQHQPYNYPFNHDYNQQNQHQQNQNRLQQNQQRIPGFGVAFSSGLRYYVPQFYYYDSRQQQPQQQYQRDYQKSHHDYNEVHDNAIYGH